MSASTHGALIVDVRTSSMNAQGFGIVDVYLRGDPGDTLGAFGYEFNITGATPQSGDLQFRATQSSSEQSEAGAPPSPPYVFFGDTDSIYFNSVLGGDAVTLRGGDSLASLDSVSVDGEFLLARLELEHVGSLIGSSHDFTVSLNPISGFTFFDRDFDPGTNDPGVTDNYSTFTSLSGTVTVNAAAVPEPSSIAGLGMLALGYLSRRWRQNSRKAIAG